MGWLKIGSVIMIMSMEKFIKDVTEITGISLTAAQQNAFRIYEDELVTWNEKFNLTAIRTSEGIRTKHFLDSLTCLQAIEKRIACSMIDIGTGAGFPGIPLKIALPDLRLTLVESVGKKAEFCRHVVEKLNLKQVEIQQARVEDLGQLPEFREQYDWAMARAVADLPVLVEYLLPLVSRRGSMVAQKGQHGPAEVQKAERAIRILGGKVKVVRKVNLPGVVEDRFLIVIEKIAATPPQYPRRVGVAIKKPL